ncbi:MAG: hypothetical protein V7750_09310 [Sneathiella sp.]
MTSMQLARTTLYPAIMLNPSALEQNGRVDIVEERLEDRRSANQRSANITDKQEVSARHKRQFGVGNEAQSQTIIPVIIQPAANTQRELTGIPQPPLGQSSSGFLVQQLAQTPTDTALMNQGPTYQNASNAYNSTLGLTATVMGMHGAQGRTI